VAGRLRRGESAERGDTLWFSSAKRISELEEDVEKLQRAMNQLKLEWGDTLEMLTRRLQRFTKRAQLIEQHEEQEQPANGSPTGSTTASSAVDPMSARILARRQRLFPPRGDQQ
jgi:hypothetical protein